MAEFCSTDCELSGSICDFCKHYKDEYRDILKLKNEDETERFAGEGICGIDKSQVFAFDGYACENFKCFKIN